MKVHFELIVFYSDNLSSNFTVTSKQQFILKHNDDSENLQLK